MRSVSSDLTLEAASLEHALELADKLRPEDAREIASASGMNPKDVLVMSSGLSLKMWRMVAGDTGETVSLFGVASSGRRWVGTPWLVASRRIAEFPQHVGRNTLMAVNLLHEHYPVLTNYADMRNTLHIRWLKWAGFRFIRETCDYARDGALFGEFIRIQHNDV